MSEVLGSLYFQQAYNNRVPNVSVEQPDPSKASYLITILPRVRALQELYKRVKPNGNYIFDHYYQATNKAQQEMIGFVGRLVRFRPMYTSIFTPNYGIFSNSNESLAYLHAQEVDIEKTPEGNALVIVSKIKFTFPYAPKQTSMLTEHNRFNVKALTFVKGYKVLQSETVRQYRVFQFPTTDPRVYLNIMQSYEPHKTETSPNQPVFEFLKYRNQRYFMTDVTYQYKSVTIPQIKLLLKEETSDLDKMYLLRVNYKTNNLDGIVIKNFIQYTNLNLTGEGFSSMSRASLNTTTKIEAYYQESIQIEDYKVNSSFMIWAEHLDIKECPLFIGYINENNFLREK